MAKLFWKYAAMNAGKSTVLLQCAHNYKERGMLPVLFTSSIDNRYKTGKITSRIGLESDALTFDNETDFFDVVTSLEKSPDVIIIDEAQFLTRNQVITLAAFAARYNVPVICYGLKTDFLGHLFEGSNALFCYAQDIQQLKTICRCGKAANHNMRIDEDGNPVKSGTTVQIGGNSMYEAVCNNCFFNKMSLYSLKARK